jgi:hypothetical protein
LESKKELSGDSKLERNLRFKGEVDKKFNFDLDGRAFSVKIGMYLSGSG